MRLTRTLGALIGLGCCVNAQHPENPRVEALEKRVEAQRKLLWDWGGLNRYGSEDSECPPGGNLFYIGWNRELQYRYKCIGTRSWLYTYY